jgi:hypothetical protein
MPVKGGGFGGFIFNPGSTVITPNTSVGSLATSNLTYTKVTEITIGNNASVLGGQVNAKFKLLAGTGGYNVYARIYINDVAVGTERITSSANPGINPVETITVNPGDRVQIYAKMTTGATFATIQEFHLEYNLLPAVPTFQTTTL